jgi:hypothetical protein
MPLPVKRLAVLLFLALPVAAQQGFYNDRPRTRMLYVRMRLGG